jgi:hypothetical protein
LIIKYSSHKRHFGVYPAPVKNWRGDGIQVAGPFIKEFYKSIVVSNQNLVKSPFGFKGRALKSGGGRLSFRIAPAISRKTPMFCVEREQDGVMILE